MRSGCGLSSTEMGGVAGRKVDQPLILRAFERLFTFYKSEGDANRFSSRCTIVLIAHVGAHWRRCFATLQRTH